MKKGEYGHIEYYKKRMLFISMIFIVLIAVLSTAVLLVFKTRNNALILLPIILVLPFARFFVNYLIVRQAKAWTMSHEIYEEVQTYLKGKIDVTAAYDVTVFSKEGVTFLDFIFIYGDIVCGLRSGNKGKFSDRDMEKYIEKLLRVDGYKMKVYVYDELHKLTEAFDKRYESIKNENKANVKRQEKVKDSILNIGV
ncbi:MAG: hypothetical protein IKQ71_01500 [Lachnospiraceae bacterium]|nr:hypothetical protein [Lachnospiraceae bacterium]